MCTPFAGRALGPGRPAGAPPSWAAGRTRRNQAARICHLTKEWWSRTSLVRATSVSTRCAAATNVDSWPVISMEKVGCSMRWPISTPLPRSAFLLRSSDHARGKGRTPGRSFLDRSPASAARRLGVHILRQAMELRAELDLSSYDRLFPTQDFVPKGSFGNLIALPLQGECRRQGNTVFLDPASLEPYEDQWAFLASIPRMSPEAVAALEKTLAPVAAGPDDTRYRRPRARGAHQKPPEVIRAVSGAMLAIDRIGVPPALVAALKHLASLHNPEYYEKERLRFSTWNTPRFLRCYGETIDQLLLPRGIADHAARMIGEAGSTLAVTDACSSPTSIDFSLQADLSDRQQSALDALIPHRSRRTRGAARFGQDRDRLRSHRPSPAPHTHSGRSATAGRAVARASRRAPRDGHQGDRSVWRWSQSGEGNHRYRDGAEPRPTGRSGAKSPRRMASSLSMSAITFQQSPSNVSFVRFRYGTGSD